MQRARDIDKEGLPVSRDKPRLILGRWRVPSLIDPPKVLTENKSGT